MFGELGSTLGIDEGTYIGSSYGSFGGSNDVTLEVSWIEDSLESYDEHAPGYFNEAEDGIFEGVRRLDLKKAWYLELVK